MTFNNLDAQNSTTFSHTVYSKINPLNIQCLTTVSLLSYDPYNLPIIFIVCFAVFATYFRKKLLNLKKKNHCKLPFIIRFPLENAVKSHVDQRIWQFKSDLLYENRYNYCFAHNLKPKYIVLREVIRFTRLIIDLNVP